MTQQLRCYSKSLHLGFYVKLDFFQVILKPNIDIYFLYSTFFFLSNKEKMFIVHIVKIPNMHNLHQFLLYEIYRNSNVF